MYKKTILIVPALLCLCLTGLGQNLDIQPYYTGERVPDLPLKHILNYKTDTASLSSFGHKLIILDFWGIHCGSCIAMFPSEDSLQKLFNNEVQFILVTTDSTAEVAALLKSLNAEHKPVQRLPVVTEDYLLRKLFRHYYIPHYAWIAPDGSLLAQTLGCFIDKGTIQSVLSAVKKNEQRLKSEHFPEEMFHFKQPGQKQLNRFIQLQNQK